jgi:broad specificity phosphatase PhoE
MKRIFLIRHGESEQNIGKTMGTDIFDGDISLTELGKEQAHQTGRYLKSYIENLNLDISTFKMWVSPYLRTEQTAEIINSYVHVKTVFEDPRLVEQDYGEFHNRHIEEWAKINEVGFKIANLRYNSTRGKFFSRFPNGESPFDVYNRISSFLETLHRDDDENVIIVCHGVVVRTFLMRFFHYPIEWYYEQINPKNCSIRLLERTKNRFEDKGYII